MTLNAVSTSTLQDEVASATAGEPCFPPAVGEQLRLRANHLKMLPAIAMQALDIAKDPDCVIGDFVSVIERDATLAADILRIANSVLFGGGRTVMNLHRAVVRVGLRQCKSLIIASSFSSMMKSMTLEEEWVRELLWQHSFTTALLSLHVNRSLNVGFQGEEFAAGLIHDIGRMLLATCFPDQFPSIDSMDFDEGPQTLLIEQNAIETNHCEVGVWFAQRNSLPEPLIDTVRFHHCPERSPRNRRLVALVATCDHMANHLQRDDGGSYDPQGNPSLELLEKCGVPNATSCFVKIASTVMETAKRDAAEMLSV